jgi:hypothetical protein
VLNADNKNQKLASVLYLRKTAGWGEDVRQFLSSSSLVHLGRAREFLVKHRLPQCITPVLSGFILPSRIMMEENF